MVKGIINTFDHMVVGHLTHKSGVLGSIPGLATYFRSSLCFFKEGSCQLLAKVWKSVIRLTDRPDIPLDVYRGRKTTMQQQQQQYTPSKLEHCLGAVLSGPPLFSQTYMSRARLFKASLAEQAL